MTKPHSRFSRRAVLGAGTAAAAATLLDFASQPKITLKRGKAPNQAENTRGSRASLGLLQPALLAGALAALDRHRGEIPHRDRMAIVDFTAPSSRPRFHLVDLNGGRTASFLVAHGSGSDPGHTGFLQSFSNTANSNASSEGAFVTADYYFGKHGRSQRLLGLDPTNCNALTRSIVVHGAWYANAEVVTSHGKLGRSQGCFAVGEKDLPEVFGRLGEGRMIYAAKA